MQLRESVEAVTTCRQVDRKAMTLLNLRHGSYWINLNLLIDAPHACDIIAIAGKPLQ